MNNEQKSRILILDIETSPIMGKVWELWKQNISLDQIESDWYIMSYAAKWLDDPDIMYADCRRNIGNDARLLSDLYLLLDAADIVVAHNGDKFDIPKINARFILSGFRPPSTYKTIDTVKAAKKHFKFSSNKLAYLTDKLCKTKKLDHAKYAGFKLWNACQAGIEDAWEEMREYNEVDVLALEELYLKLRPWMTNHPNINIKGDNEKPHCPKCGSGRLHKRGVYTTNKGVYQRYCCMDCEGWSSDSKNLTTKQQRDNLLTSR